VSFTVLLLTVVHGCDYLQWFWYLLGNDDPELSVNETLSLAWDVEHTVLQVVFCIVLHSVLSCINGK